jgi:cytochrome P450
VIWLPNFGIKKIYLAGSDTVSIFFLQDFGLVTDGKQTSSAIKTFFYYMALHPEIQKKAQEEIDRVVGNQRLPDFNDRQSMPYSDAIYREVMRIRPVFPLDLPHTSTEDDIYNGYFIPKGRIPL